jgi:hypothetical protein
MILSIDSSSETVRQAAEKYSGQEGFELVDSRKPATSSGRWSAHETNFTVQDRTAEPLELMCMRLSTAEESTRF